MLTVDEKWAIDFYKTQFPITKGCLHRNYRLQEADIENILQEAMIVLLQKELSEIKEIGSYFHKVAINLANKSFSKKRSSLGEEELDDGVQPNDEKGNQLDQLEVLEQIETESCVVKVLKTFEQKHPKHSEVIRLINNDGLNGKQIADYLGKKEDTARQYCYQARKYYLAILYEYCEMHFSEQFWKKRGFNG